MGAEGFAASRTAQVQNRPEYSFLRNSPDMIVKCTDWDPVFYAPLAVGKSAGSTLAD